MTCNWEGLHSGLALVYSGVQLVTFFQVYLLSMLKSQLIFSVQQVTIIFFSINAFSKQVLQQNNFNLFDYSTFLTMLVNVHTMPVDVF